MSKLSRSIFVKLFSFYQKSVFVDDIYLLSPYRQFPSHFSSEQKWGL